MRAIMKLVRCERIPLVRFEKGVRKDEVMKKELRKFRGQEAVLFVGVAQEKARVPRTIRKRFGDGGSIPWIDYTSAMVNFYYFLLRDEDFGPFFIKFCSYFPYTAKLCLNGHEYVKRQLQKRGISFEALDNGLLRCEQIERRSASPRGSVPGRSRPSFANGCANCRIPSPARNGLPDTAMNSRCCRPNFPSHRSGTGP